MAQSLRPKADKPLHSAPLRDSMEALRFAPPTEVRVTSRCFSDCIWLARFFAIALLFLSSAATAQQPPAFSADLRDIANDHIYNLEYEAATAVLEKCLAKDPHDLRALNLLANAMLRREMFRKGLMEVAVYGDEGDVYKPAKTAPNQQFEDALMQVLNRSLDIANQRIAKNPKDVEAYYWAGVTYGTRGIYNFSVRRSYSAALGDSKNAVRFHRKVLELDPQSVDPLLTVGVHNYVVGSLPWYLKVFAKLSGTHGNKAEGLAQVKRVTEQGNYARDDARFVYALLTMREGNTAEALRTLKLLSADFPRNFLLMQEVAGVHRVRKEWASALETYDEIFARRQIGAPGFTEIPAARLFYLAGQTANNAGEPVRALRYFEQGLALNTADVYVMRSKFEAARLLQQSQQHETARVLYQQVLEAAPNSPEGKLAKKALQEYKRSSG
jgi:tetratricopeptide (TPR) repeat protein